MSKILQIEDIPRFKNIGEVKISPDGKYVAYTLRSIVIEENKSNVDLFVSSISDGDIKKLNDDGKASLIAWSPNGKWISYVQGDKDGNNIMIVDVNSGLKRKICTYNVSNASLGFGCVGDMVIWSPDSSKIAYLGSLEPVDKEAKIKVINRIMYRAFFGNSDMRRRHIFVVNTLGQEPPKQLTFEDFDEHSITWSPDGEEIAFVSNRTGLDDYNMHLDIYTVNVSTREIKRITNSVGAEYNPTYSPNGKMIACIATERGNTSNESTPEDHHLWVYNLETLEGVCLTKKLDKPIGSNPQWLDDSNLIFTYSDEGRVPIAKVSINGHISIIRSGDQNHSRVTVAKNEAIAFTCTSPNSPEDIYTLTPQNIENKITDLNPWLKEYSLAYPEEFRFTGSDGTKLHGWIIKPQYFDSSKKYPTLLNIKGGPSGMHGYGWNMNQQLATSNGFIQVYVNYRGSSGYGQKFTDAIVGDMLGGEYRDNMEALEYAIKTCPNIDINRLGVWGGSYGGYLTNWIITQTDRFKAAVSISSISNLWTQWGCGALPLWVEVELPGLPWDNYEKMIKQSPIWQAHKARTPTLFLHGEQDYDTPIVEAEQMFMALKKNGVEATLVRYVEEGHGVRSKPQNNMDVMRRVFSWFKTHL
ncbi:S9 family peptidase [Candidatus Bathyarchaeota archaeon]|nr:S9 family peptidase [Candidatus Bathyarchaeota archaeon]